MEFAELFESFYKDPEQSRRKSLVLDPGNQFFRPGDYGLFFAVPSWWRGFIFWVLTPSEFMAYAYLCTQMGPDAIAFPTGKHFQVDLMRDSKTTIYRYIRKLVEKGFIIKERRAPLRREYTLRNIYQRPTPEFTVLHLLQADIIDAELRPTDHRFKNIDPGEISRHNAAIQDGLRRLMLKRDYRKYQEATTTIAKKSALVDGLAHSLERKRSAGQEALWGKRKDASAASSARTASPKAAQKKAVTKPTTPRKHVANKKPRKTSAK